MSRHVISEMGFGTEIYEIKDAVARGAISSLNSFEYAVCDRAENTPVGVTFTPSSSETLIEGTLVPSADTKYKIYLVPSEDEDPKNNYLEYITIEETTLVNDIETPVYRWEKIGTIGVKNANPVFTGSITLGQTSVTEPDLISILELANIPSAEGVSF